MKYQNDVCGSGYIHGVVESYFEEHKNQHINPLALCSKTDGRCFHGVGHGYMFYYDYDLNASVHACQQLKAPFARTNCLDGVFMQYFSTGDSMKVSDESFNVCAEFQINARGSCYFYAPRYHLKYSDSYHEVYGLCKVLSQTDKSICIKGIGSGLTKYNMHNVQVAEDFCFQMSSPDKQSCVSGMLSYYIVHFNDHQKGRDLCDTLADNHKALCENEYRKKKTPGERVE